MRVPSAVLPVYNAIPPSLVQVFFVNLSVDLHAGAISKQRAARHEVICDGPGSPV